MGLTKIAALSLATSAYAFPGMIPEKRQGNDGNLLDNLGTATGLHPLIDTVESLSKTVGGLVGSVIASVDQENLRPEPGFDFIAPGPNDSRGPCPGLNLLANHGYLPRDGHVTFDQVLEATARGFNMGTDLAAVLSTFAVLADGDIATESWYLGASPDGTAGLNRHSTVEADISPNREDFYNGCGDNHHLSSRMFRRNVGIVADSQSKEFDLYNMGTHYSIQADFAKQNNPFLYYFPFPSIVSVGAYVFYPNFFSNGTYGAGGVANYDSISSIIGAKYDDKSGQFEYVPERFPENWYRRAVEYDAVAVILDGFGPSTYLRNPVGMPFGQLGTANLNATTVLCDTYQGINSIVPGAGYGGEDDVESAITWALNKLDPHIGPSSILGCPRTAVSSNFALYPNANQEGGPQKPPPSVANNVWNNVYNKVYFTDAPVQPQCNH